MKARGERDVAPGKGGSGYLEWNACPVCAASIVAIVPAGTAADASVRARVEDVLVNVASPAAAAAAAALKAAGAGPLSVTLAAAAAATAGGDAHGPLGDGFGGADGPVSPAFKTLFKRAARMLEAHVAAGGGARGPPTRSDLARADYDDSRDLWLDAAEWTWDEGMSPRNA